MKRRLVVVAALALTLLLAGCGGRAASQVPPDELPLALARDLYADGYTLVSYHEVDWDRDGLMESLAVLTQKVPTEHSFLSSSYVVLFHQEQGTWVQSDRLRMDGERATTALHDLTGDGFPELVVSTQQVYGQEGDFIAPLRTAGYLSAFTYTPDKVLVELGTYSSSLLGQDRVYPQVGEWEGQTVIRVARDLPATESPLWQPYQVGDYAWNGSEFGLAQVQEQRRLSPLISWVVARNAPWTGAFLILGGVLGGGAFVISQRTRLDDRWSALGAAAIIVAGGIGLGLVQEWLCILAPILAGLVGLLIGRRVTRGGSL
jgi:hypothetical protein